MGSARLPVDWHGRARHSGRRIILRRYEQHGCHGNNRRGHDRSSGSACRVLVPHGRQHRCCVRRHRNLAALCIPRGGSRRHPWRAGDAGHCAWRAVVDPLGAVHRRHRQIRAVPAARRQQWRRRNAIADGARPARARSPELGAAGARRARRLDVHRRFHDHASDLGAVSRRGSQAQGACTRALCRSDHHHHSRCAVLGAADRHRQGGVRFRPDHDRLVHGARADGGLAYYGRPDGAEGDQSVLCRAVHAHARYDRSGDAGRGVPGGDRRSSMAGSSSCCRRC